MKIDLISITGCDDENSVIGLYVADGSFVTARFSTDTAQPTSLHSRIVNRYFNKEVQQPSETFPDFPEMRAAIEAAVLYVVPSCMADLSVKDPDVLVEIVENSHGAIAYSLCHEANLYRSYLSLLKPLEDILTPSQIEDSSFEFVDVQSLVIVRPLMDGHNTAVVVRDPFSTDPESGKKYFFKAQHFSDFLTTGEEMCGGMIRAQYNEIATLHAMPPHPNILPPNDIFVTTPSAEYSDSSQHTLICGMLQPLYENGDLEEYLKDNVPSLEQKAQWCFQLVSAIHHVHFAGNRYHIDLKPSNMVLDSNLNLIVIDWENEGANKSIRPPEADGSFDVHAEELPSGEIRLKYEKYIGPRRQNSASTLVWNVFPIWNRECRLAVELAQVYSLGRAMWMILTRTPSEELKDRDIWWVSEAIEAIPDSWKKVIENCICKDPNDRVRLEVLLQFWKGVSTF